MRVNLVPGSKYRSCSGEMRTSIRRYADGQLTTRQYEKGGVQVLTLAGSITLGSGDTTVRDMVKDLVAGGHKKILIDLGGVTFMDSTGLGEMVAAYSHAKGQQASMKLCSLTKKIDDLMQITQLASVFETYESVDEGLSSFN